MIAIPLPRVIASFSFTVILRAMCVIVQNRKRIVNALQRADIAFTIAATWVGSEANSENRRPVIMKNGAPGGCPTSSLKAEDINSPQSQNDAVGSIVSK